MNSLRDPFNPDSGEFAKNIRSITGLDDDELRKSLKSFGWHKEFPAIIDENDVVLVGHRRLRLAKQIGIEPVTKKITLGKGDEADAERLKLALISNIGGQPLTRDDRKRIAEHLYGKRDWTIERIGAALNVGFSTIQRDLGNLPAAGKLNPAKTASNPKGAGRPKGSKPKPRAETAPQAVAREERVAVLMDMGKTAQEIAAELGVVTRAANQAMEHVKIRREAEAIIDPSTLSISAQQKNDVWRRQEMRRLSLSFEQRVSDEVSRRLNEMGLPLWKERIDEAKRIYDRRKGIMSKEIFNAIRRGLHPDSRNSISDKVLSAAFDAFMGLEKFLLNEKDSPTNLGHVPKTVAEWDVLKQKANAERKAKRNGSANIAVRR